MHEPMAHRGRMTKPELICHLIAAVLEERAHLQAETENGGARGGELVEPTFARKESLMPWFTSHKPRGRNVSSLTFHNKLMLRLWTRRLND